MTGVSVNRLCLIVEKFLVLNGVALRLALLAQLLSGKDADDRSVDRITDWLSVTKLTSTSTTPVATLLEFYSELQLGLRSD